MSGNDLLCYVRMPHVDLLILSACAWVIWSAYWFIAAQSVNAAKSSEGWLLRMQHLVPLAVGFLLIFHGGRSFIYGRLHHANWLSLAGLALTVLGLLFAVWGRFHLGRYWSGIITLKEGHELIRSGPYRLVRHPLYTGFLLAVLGSALTAGTADALAGFLLILIAYLIKVRREEAVLSREFGDQYVRFKREVAALCPFVY